MCGYQVRHPTSFVDNDLKSKVHLGQGSFAFRKLVNYKRLGTRSGIVLDVGNQLNSDGSGKFGARKIRALVPSITSNSMFTWDTKTETTKTTHTVQDQSKAC